MNLQSAINANRKREQEKQLKAKQLHQDVTKLDWDTFITKRSLESGSPCYEHKALPEIIAALRGAVYNMKYEAAAYLLPSELANIGGYNYQHLHKEYEFRLVDLKEN